MERTHYSGSVFGITGKYFYKVTHGAELTGAAIFGAPAAYNVAAKYAPGGEQLVELRRFCLAQHLPKNSESRTLGIMLRDLRKRGVGVVISYADPAHGHRGTIYRAAGFDYLGTTTARTHFLWKGKLYPDRNLHQTKFPFHLQLRAAVDSGEAKRVKIPGKHIYLRRLS